MVVLLGQLGLLLLLLLVSNCDMAFNHGKDFVLVFPELKGSNGPAEVGSFLIGQTDNITLNIQESGTSTGPVTLTTTEKYQIFAISNTIIGSGKFDHLVRLTTDVDIAVFGITHTTDRGETFSSIPVTALGTDYVTVTHCEVVDQPCQIQIVSLDAGTTVTVTLPSRTVSVDFAGSTYVNGESFVINFGQNEVAQIQSQFDITGTRITSNVKVAVFSGSTGTSIQGTNEGFLLKPMPPVNTWGKDHITVPTPGRSNTGDYFRILTSEPNTEITISGESSFVLPKSGQWIQRNLSNSETKRIISDKAIMVVRLTVSQRDATEPGSPTMVVLIPTEQFVKGTDVTVPKISATTLNTVTIVTKDVYNGTMLLNSSPINGWVPVEGTVYQTAEMDVSSEYSTVSSSDPDAEFAVYFYGRGAMSNAYIGGRNYADINPPCTVSSMSIGDEVDNDCDGLIDEDTCTPTDYMGKDCAVIVSGQRDVYGKEFVFIFPYHTDASRMNIFLTTPATGVSVTLEQPNLDGILDTQVIEGTQHHFNLSSSYQTDTDLSNKTLRLTASSEITIVAYSTDVVASLTAGTFRVIPTDGLGREYFALTYCETAFCFITVSAVHPDTIVRVEVVLEKHQNPITFDDNLYFHGDVVVIGLAQYESAQIVSLQNDMSGTRITSNKPVSVVSGGNYTKCKSGNQKDMMVEQLIPTQSLGRLGAAVQTPGRMSSKDFIRVMSIQDSTSFTLTMNGNSTVYSFVRKGTFHDFELLDRCVVEADKPIQVAQLLADGPITYDSAMTIVVPVEQYSNGDHLVLPSGDDIGQKYDFHLITVTIICNQTDTANIELDGSAISQWTDMPGLLLAVTTPSILKGERNISGSVSSTVGGHVSTNMKQLPAGSFSFPLAFKLNLINQPCAFSESIPGDGVDNDCDGWVDEENCTSLDPEDKDFDGMFDEDCQLIPMESSPIATSSAALYASLETSLNEELTSLQGHTTSIAASVIGTLASIEPSATVVASTATSTLQSSLDFPLDTTDREISAEHSCTCICSSLAFLDASSLTEVVENIRRELTVNKETVSQTLRKKTSAPDDRPSAVSMGYVGIAVISSLFVGIFVLDAGSLFRDVVSLINSMKNSCRANESKI